jgi:DNA-binding Lrp family transcriptional regulator
MDKPAVRDVSKITGHYDIVITAEFEDLKSLEEFGEDFNSSGRVEAMSVHPALKFWERGEPQEKPVVGWTFIQTFNVDRMFEEMQKVGNIVRLYTTLGPYNLIANIGAEDIREIQKTIREKIHCLGSVIRTETLTSQASE